jgi:hypothetical protein
MFQVALEDLSEVAERIMRALRKLYIYRKRDRPLRIL